MTQPVHNADSILAANRIAFREEAIEVFIENARQDIAEGAIVLLGGDFNEPSHLDWQEDTKDLWDHNGVVINWDCSSILCKKDSRTHIERYIRTRSPTRDSLSLPTTTRCLSAN